MRNARPRVRYAGPGVVMETVTVVVSGLCGAMVS